MRRITGALVLTVMLGAFGGARPATAAAWMWMAGNNWSYSAAACAAPPSAFYAWVLWTGPTYAFANCAGAFGSSGAQAAAIPGVGGAGAGFALGFADPNAYVSVPDTSNPASFSGSSYTFTTNGNGDLTGISFPTAGNDAELNATDQISAFLFTGNDCTAFAGGNCPANNSDQSSGGFQPGDIATLEADSIITSNDVLATLNNDQTNNLTGLTFSTPLPSTDKSQIVLMAYGDAVSTPEPGSLLVFAAGLGGLLLARGGSRRRR